MTRIYSDSETLSLLDELFLARQNQWWDQFFTDRNKPCPFFIDVPDENLVEAVNSGALQPGRVLEIGCGNGRNALFLAKHGFEVDAIDFSQKAIDWALEKQANAGDQSVTFICDSVFDFEFSRSAYDFVYDCGCFHHIAPHRRRSFTEVVTRALKPGGLFGLICFAPEGGSGLTDLEVYQQQSLKGGLGYSAEELRELFSHCFEIQSIRRMRDNSGSSDSESVFGKDFLWVAMMRLKAQN